MKSWPIFRLNFVCGVIIAILLILAHRYRIQVGYAADRIHALSVRFGYR